ncbi:hypothetical protein NC653_025167 [Populus alba x Populus x berolinensis]|uniref:Xylanase inhibitor N-terminal domain-containing protein n=1 Tax=Populus alba x Populus x berolinensis TaxID=444605 RepID=A0AAD6Q8R1_9ROSI|nr:hypothetical protein NC653_025167 [Populus alba x Populus x berolinensis]
MGREGDSTADFLAKLGASREDVEFIWIYPLPGLFPLLAGHAPGAVFSRGAQGTSGLGKIRIAVPSQLASNFGLKRKFATCLASSNGLMLFGSEPGYDSVLGTEISRSLIHTPLVTSPDARGSSQEYFINVKSVKINGKRLS